MTLRLIRHATLWIEYAGVSFLVDPMFAGSGKWPSLTLGNSSARNPLRDIDVPLTDLTRPDVVVVSHGHFDHFDGKVRDLLSKQVVVICPPSVRKKMDRAGFSNITVVEDTVDLGGVRIDCTDGRHGHEIMGALMGSVAGFVFRAEGEPVVYIAGDTVWVPAVRDVLSYIKPEVVVLNARAARFNIGGPITMDSEDVVRVCREAPEAHIVAVHIDTINHCRLSRRELRSVIATEDLSGHVSIPSDGDVLSL